MPSVSVLYIEDSIVGPHLELLRNICEPDSTSRPHITVRFWKALTVPSEYQTTTITHINLLEPGAFGLEANDEKINRTVFIKCKSDELAPLEHKPDFPTSKFHITVYDGHSSAFAKKLLQTLNRFDWNFILNFPNDAKLETLLIKPSKLKRPPTSRIYGKQLRKIFLEATSHELNWSYVTNLTDKERIEVVILLCENLQKWTRFLDRTEISPNFPVSEFVKDTSTKNKSTQVHLTPPELARDIAEYTVSLIDPEEKEIHFGDPAVGNGVFYSALLQILPHQKITSAVGVDINSEQVAEAKWRWENKGMQVLRDDYLHMEKLPHRTLILANPPYLRHQKISDTYKKELRERASITMKMRVDARSGQYVYFLLLSHAWMCDDAIAAWLIPSEFMQTQYGKALRDYLTNEVSLIRIHQFGFRDSLFENVSILPSVVIFKNTAPDKDLKCILSVGGSLSNPIKSSETKVSALRNKSKWSLTNKRLSKKNWSKVKIRDIFTVRRGIATGANDFFVMTETEAQRLNIPNKFLKPLIPKIRTLISDVIERNEDGSPKVSNELFVFDCDIPESQIEESYPQLIEFLAKAKNQGVLDRTLVRKRTPWYKQEKRLPAPYLCSYMGRSIDGRPPIKFIWNKSDAIVTNTYLMLYPRDLLAQKLTHKPKLGAELLALLKEASQKTMSESWRTHAGGLHKIEPGELLDVFLPNCPKWLEECVERDLLSDS